MKRSWLLASGLWAGLWLTALLPAAAAAPSSPDPLDWPSWRGPEQNGISREKNLPEKLDIGDRSPTLVWKNAELGGISTPIILRGKLYYVQRTAGETPAEGERLVCADAATGKILWENKFNIFLSAVPSERVGWSNAAADPASGRVFVQGVCGYFQCVDGESGKTIWSRSLAEEFGILSTYGGRTATPVLFEDLVIVNGVMTGWGEFARPAQCFLAMNKDSGEVVWLKATKPFPEDTTYSTPVLTTIKGQAALVVGASDGAMWAFQPRTGNPLWQFQVSRRGINVSPVVLSDKVYFGHSEENLDNVSRGAMLCIDGTGAGEITKTGEVWRLADAMCGISSPLVVDGRMYQADDSGRLYIVDIKTGEQVGQPVRLVGTIMRASPVYADGKIYLCTTTGMHVLQPTASGVKVLFKQRLPNRSAISGSPAVSHGRVYIPTLAGIYCFANQGAKPEADAIPPAAEETPARDADAVAQVVVTPAEALLKPGAKQKFTINLYNARGQKLSSRALASYSLEGPGEVDQQGQFVAASAPAHTATVVSAKVGEVVGKARVRVVPNLPWKFDFNDGRVPVTWIGARYRHVAIDFDLFEKLNRQSPQAGQMYLALMTGFTNQPPPGSDKLVYETKGPRPGWPELVRFLREPPVEGVPLENVASTQADVQKRVEPALKILQQEKVVAGWTWGSGPGPSLTVQRGPRKIDGNGVMLKITTIPKGAKSQCWMGPAGLHDYTVQADVRGALKNKKMADVGLVAQRYTLDLMGEYQKLQIRSWSSQLNRFSQDRPQAVKPDAWYTLKFRAAVENGKAVLRGKVWPRGEQEPAAWMIEAADGAPDVLGSPGLYGNANDSEVFIDNVVITPNSNS